MTSQIMIDSHKSMFGFTHTITLILGCLREVEEGILRKLGSVHDVVHLTWEAHILKVGYDTVGCREENPETKYS